MLVEFSNKRRLSHGTFSQVSTFNCQWAYPAPLKNKQTRKQNKRTLWANQMWPNESESLLTRLFIMRPHFLMNYVSPIVPHLGSSSVPKIWYLDLHPGIFYSESANAFWLGFLSLPLLSISFFFLHWFSIYQDCSVPGTGQHCSRVNAVYYISLAFSVVIIVMCFELVSPWLWN